MIEKLNAIGISDAMITSTVITVIICVLAIIAGRRIEMIPSGFQNMIELGIEKLHGFFEGIMGKYACDKYFPLIATLFIYILFCNYSGLIPLAGEAPGFQAPTSNVNFPAGMGNNRVLCSPDYRACRAQRHQVLQTSFQAGGLYISAYGYRGVCKTYLPHIPTLRQYIRRRGCNQLIL